MISLMQSIVTQIASTTGGTGAMPSFADVMSLLSKAVTIGGALWLVWGVVVLAGALKDKNGPALQGGIWQIIGGALIAAAALWFGNITW
jgi:hypothetical protein